MSIEHKITIFRTSPFLAKAQGSALDDFFESSKVSIGSYYEKGGSPRIATGLSFEEEKLLLPEMLEVPADHPEFRKKVADFYANLTIKVPYKGGTSLNIALTSDSKGAVSKSNMPEDLLDYLKYRVAIKHPDVAASSDISEGNSRYKFYVFDPIAAQNKKTAKRDQEDSAQKAYLEIKDDEQKVKQALVLLGINPHTEKDPVAKLKDQAKIDPAKFLKTIGLKEFEIKYWITSMIDYKVIKLLNSKYFDAETDKLLAQSEEELIFFFKDDSNSDVIGTLKARLQDKTL